MEKQEVNVLTHEGVERFRGTPNECWIKLLKSQGQSTDYAIKYGGWKILTLEEFNKDQNHE